MGDYFLDMQYLLGSIGIISLSTACPRCLDQFYIVGYYLKWVTSWAYSKLDLWTKCPWGNLPTSNLWGGGRCKLPP